MIRREAFLLKSLPRNRWALAAAALGVITVVTAEVCSRLLAPNPRPSLVAHVPQHDEWFVEKNGHIQTTYQGEFQLHDFSPRPPGTRARVAWLGGSSLRGGSLPDLEAPSVMERTNRTENLNLAAPGLESRHFVAMLPEVLALNPTVLIVYAGHNDRGNAVFEALGQGTGGGLMLRAIALLSKSRLFQLAQHALLSVDGLIPMSGDALKAAHISEARAAEIRGQFESNLRSLVRSARAAGVKVILSTPVSNPLAHPFAYQCPEEIRALGLPTSHESHGAFDLSDLDPEALHAAISRSPTCREIQIFQARLAITTGQPVSGIEQLDALRDENPLPVSADRRTIELIRAIAREEGALLADVAAEFRQAGGGIEPPGWFWDPNHLRKEGHVALAAVVGPVLEGALGLPPSQWSMPELPALTLDGRKTGLEKQPPPDEMP